MYKASSWAEHIQLLDFSDFSCINLSKEWATVKPNLQNNALLQYLLLFLLS